MILNALFAMETALNVQRLEMQLVLNAKAAIISKAIPVTPPALMESGRTPMVVKDSVPCVMVNVLCVMELVTLAVRNAKLAIS